MIRRQTVTQAYGQIQCLVVVSRLEGSFPADRFPFLTRGRSLLLSDKLLGRINPIKVASERHPDPTIREELVKRGYVTGMDVKEPAVKTLNAMVATLAVETLVNQYTEREQHVPILVYEQNRAHCIYADTISVETRNKHCFLCQGGPARMDIFC